MADKDVLGRWGEDLAAAYLEEAGLTILARNWRCRHGELDIVAADGHTVVFCEVKTRSGVAFGVPAEAVGWQKVRRIRLVAATWLAEAGRGWPELRFDVVRIVRPRGQEPTVEHLRGAF